MIERIFDGGGGKVGDLYRQALRYDRRNAAGYPCAVQLGAINEPCDNIERNQGWLLDFLRLCIKYRQPVRISTKGRLLQVREYLDVIAEAPELFWVSFSIITPDDDLLTRIDRRAPNATARLATMAALSKLGVRTALRFRPIIPGVSDSTANYPQAYRVLIERAAEAGAYAISYEVAFAPGMPTKEVKWRWNELSKYANVGLLTLYKKFGPRSACMRPAYTWTEGIMHAIRDVAHENGLVIGVSDPVWKQLGDTGCCCGMLPDDPIWGNWQPESATNQLLVAKETGKLLGPDDITPAWARVVRLSSLANLGVGPLTCYDKRHVTWADKLRQVWNNTGSERGPLNYFQGALQPVSKQGEDVFYKYVGLERQHLSVPYWKV